MLIKSDKGRHELSAGVRTLGQRERAVLLMADGQRSTATLCSLFEGEGKALVAFLVKEGYLLQPAKAAAKAPVTQPQPAPAGASAAPSAHGESFVGTRSLATARMFLFDLSERLFAPRDKALAANFRDALREARDAMAMLAVGREMITKVEELAGSERADGISERLARLLPPDFMHSAA